MYISGFKVLDSYLFIQHDDPILNDEIEMIKHLVGVADQRYQSEMEVLRNLTEGLF
jgi:hypothetical protein